MLSRVGEDRTVRLWDAKNGNLRGIAGPHPTKIETALLSPDGRRLLTISHQKPKLTPSMWGVAEEYRNLGNKALVTLWDTAACGRINDLSGHLGHVNDAVFSPDGQTILTAGADGTARLWSAGRGTPLATLRDKTGPFIGVGFSPDGFVAATLRCREEGELDVYTVQWWDPRRSEQIGVPCVHSGEHWSDRESPAPFRCIRRDVAILDGRSALFMRGMTNGITFPITIGSTPWVDEGFLFDALGVAYDRASGNLRTVPPRREFDPELARFAREGRFFVAASPGIPASRQQLIDLVTEKQIGRASDGALRYVPDRKTFVFLNHFGAYKTWHRLHLVPLYMPIPSTRLDPDVAQLVAEVATCQELAPPGTTRALDEPTWNKRRKQLAERLEQNTIPNPITRLASDPWHWLRRKIDQASQNAFSFDLPRGSSGISEGGHDITAKDTQEIKYLDRLIAVEPSWQNYYRRARARFRTLYVGAARDREDRDWKAAQDYLDARKRGGVGLWLLDDPRGEASVSNLTFDLIWPATHDRKRYQLGLALAEALSETKPKDRDRRVLLAIGRYRAGHYPEALSVLKTWEQEQAQTVASWAGQLHSLGWPAVLTRLWNDPIRWDTVQATGFLAMTHYRMGHYKEATGALNDLRRQKTRPVIPSQAHPGNPGIVHGLSLCGQVPQYQELLREAESLIEQRPGAEKGK